MYGKRKNWQEGQLAAESKRLNNQARYIIEQLEEKIKIRGDLKDIISLLKERKYDSDPVKAWGEKVGASIDSGTAVLSSHSRNLKYTCVSYRRQ